jgi:outer membrane biosynthesis protein TonB
MSNDQIMKELKHSRQELKNATMSNNQDMQELKTASISDNENIQNLAKIEGHIDYLVAEFNRMEEEELQSQLMAEGHYMIDEDDASHSCHEHVPDTTILESKEIVDNNEEEGKEEQIVDDIEEKEEKDEQIQHIEEQEEKEDQIEHRDQIEQEEQVEHKKKIEPPADTSPSNDKEVSTEAHSFIIVPLETHHESKALILQCLKEPSYAKILKDLCRQAHKSWNHRQKKIFPNKQVGYLRWGNILPECYQILKKKGWKGLVGHPHDRGRYGNFYFFIFCI